MKQIILHIVTLATFMVCLLGMSPEHMPSYMPGIVDDEVLDVQIMSCDGQSPHFAMLLMQDRSVFVLLIHPLVHRPVLPPLAFIAPWMVVVDIDGDGEPDLNGSSATKDGVCRYYHEAVQKRFQKSRRTHGVRLTRSLAS